MVILLLAGAFGVALPYLLDFDFVLKMVYGRAAKLIRQIQLFPTVSYRIYCRLQRLEKTCCVAAVHLHVVKLE